MRFDFTQLAIAAIGLGLSAPATAATFTFSGQGAVDSVRGSLPRNEAASVGTPFRFNFTFDTAALAFLDGDEQNAFYDLPVTNFTASIGSYNFFLSAEQGFEPVLAISRGFTFFDQPFSEPTLITTFNFASTRSSGSSIDIPFSTNVGAYGALTINAFFRASVNESGVGPDEIKNPSSADNLTFSYTTRDPVTRQSGTVSGAYSGGFASDTPLPEPATWGLMLVGFGLIGSSLRSHRCRTSLRC